MAQHPTTMRKAELIRIALGLKLGPSKSALDVHTRGVLLKMVMDALNATPRGDQP